MIYQTNSSDLLNYYHCSYDLTERHPLPPPQKGGGGECHWSLGLVQQMVYQFNMTAYIESVLSGYVKQWSSLPSFFLLIVQDVL